MSQQVAEYVDKEVKETSELPELLWRSNACSSICRGGTINTKAGDEEEIYEIVVELWCLDIELEIPTEPLMGSTTIKVTRTKRSSEEHSLGAWLGTSKDEGR